MTISRHHVMRALCGTLSDTKALHVLMMVNLIDLPRVLSMLFMTVQECARFPSTTGSQHAEILRSQLVSCQ